jgi:hypothetical protein
MLGGGAAVSGWPPYYAYRRTLLLVLNIIITPTSTHQNRNKEHTVSLHLLCRLQSFVPGSTQVKHRPQFSSRFPSPCSLSQANMANALQLAV